jgi:hypothetical protein
MYEADIGGPPAPPFRHRRGGRRNNKGCLGFWTAIPTGDKIKMFVLLLGMLASFGLFIYWVWPRSEEVAADEPIMIETVTGLETATWEATTIPVDLPLLTPDPLTTTVDIERTATFQAAISRPAAFNDPGAAPYFVGVVTYEAGCPVSNLGFTTSGYNGQPYFLYFNQPLDRDPLMQLIQITGIVQEFGECPFPVIFVQQLFWMDLQGTPAPISYGGSLTGTGTITFTNPVSGYNPANWGLNSFTPMPGVGPGTVMPLPSATMYLPPPVTPLATYTAYPTYTPYPAPHPYPTYTAYPTYTPDPATATPTSTATPDLITLYGPVQTVAGCPQSNFSVNASGQVYFILFAGVTLPPDDPTQYYALIVGQATSICNGLAIIAQSITWYQVTPTPTFTPTLTPTFTPTLTPTAVITPATPITPTAVITP